MTAVIEKNIPLPARANARKSVVPWASMKPGDSVFLPGYVQTGAQRKKGDETIISLNYAKVKVPGSAWACRVETKDGVRGVRVWRTA
jgi:hypothetical protein